MTANKIALLRGINVGGKNPLKMVALRDLLTRAGLKEVRSYIQSGNICFQSPRSRSDLETMINQQIATEFGYEVPVMVREQRFFQQAVDQNPFVHCDEAKLHLTLLSRKPAAAKIASIQSLDFGADLFTIVGDVAYVCCPIGYGKTKLTNRFFESNLDVSATTRNWKTIGKLIRNYSRRQASGCPFEAILFKWRQFCKFGNFTSWVNWQNHKLGAIPQ